MFNNKELPKMELGGTLNNACCRECRHSFAEGDEILITDALFKVVGGKLVLNDHNPNIICFPGDSDGHYGDNKNS